MNKQEFESIPNHLPIDWEAEKQKEKKRGKL